MSVMSGKVDAQEADVDGSIINEVDESVVFIVE